MTRRPKKAKPSFDVARGPLGNTGAGWVYRSAPPPEIVDLSATALKAGPPAARARPLGKRVEAGVDLLLSPFTLSLMVLFVKMRWIIGPRAGR
jgi:hypothetical protein